MKAPNFEECVKFALTQKGIGGDSFKDTNLRVYERRIAHPDTILKTLNKGGIVIPAVTASLLGGNDDQLTATVIIHVNQTEGLIDLYDPKTKEIKTVPFVAFVEAWEAADVLCMTAFLHDDTTYRPKLIDLKHVSLPKGIDELREAIAENAHDMWALERQSEGWTYGPKRDDDKLETPDMVPYAQLPESEKQYDRIMAEDTLRLLIALGYKIVHEE